MLHGNFAVPAQQMHRYGDNFRRKMKKPAKNAIRPRATALASAVDQYY
jgi:hypothetical protein